MSLRRCRVHHCGMSNIDYRSKNDTESLKIFQPWKHQKNFGSMGYIDYHLPFDQYNELFDVSKELNSQKNLRQESPDPKVWSSAKFYHLKKIDINKRNMNINDKLGELDESIKGKDKYIGDSMMISDSRKSRIERKKKIINDLEQSRNRLKQQTIKRRMLIQPVQSRNDKNIPDSKIDLHSNKIKEVRIELRRRYENSNDIRKIFKEWDSTLTSEVSVYDIHSMINNRLNIPINHTEAKALIDYSNKRNTNGLNLEEFIHLIYSDAPVSNKDKGPILFKCKSQKDLSEGYDSNKLNSQMRNNIIEMNKTLEYPHLKKYLQTKTNTLMKNIIEIQGSNEEKCSLDTLSKAIRKLPLQEIYLKDSYIKAIYDEYIDNDDQKMNYKKFIDDCRNIPSDKMALGDKDQGRTIKLFQGKINNLTQRLKLDFTAINSDKEDKKKTINEACQKQIEEKKLLDRQRYYSPRNEVNSCQPSLAFINKIFEDRNSRYKKYNEIENSFRSLPSSLNVLSPKTRFNGNPPIKNTALNIQADEKSFMYQNETDRFNIRDSHAMDIVQLEKELKYSKRKKKLERIAETMKKAQSSSNIHIQSLEQRDILSQMFKAKKFLAYENLNQLRNNVFQE